MTMTSLEQLNAQLQEAFDNLWDDYVDPREAFAGEQGTPWRALGSAGLSARPMALEQLAEIRQQCRQLLLENEFAINGVENRISYVVGSGHNYLVTSRQEERTESPIAREAQRVLDEFLEINQWYSRQQEIVRRLDRDGEVFLYTSFGDKGTTRVRFIEPEDIATPPHAHAQLHATHGIVTDPGDVEQVRGYYVGGRLVAAEEIQHRKANVDRNVKRGVPLYAPVRSNLRRAEKLLRNMSAVAEIQSAIALIRKHRAGTSSGIENFVRHQADASRTSPGGRTQRMAIYGPGTILDAPAGLEYDFPATGVDASAFVTILQAELRAIAARLVMPEFMFTSDASNANYASTMVAEGPAMRMFERLQQSLLRDDQQLLGKVLDHAAMAGRLPRDVRRQVDIQVIPPNLITRNALEDAQVCEIAFRHGLLSPQTWSQRLGLDYEREQRNRGVAGSGFNMT